MSVLIVNIVVANADAILPYFDKIKVYRSTTGASGPYTEVSVKATRPALVSLQVVYPFKDETGDPSYFYKSSYYNSASTQESALSDAQQGSGDPALALLTVDDLKTNYLFGIDLTDPHGNPMPDSLFQYYIKAAVSWLEIRLDIPLRLLVVTQELQDYYREDHISYMEFQLDHYPVVSVQAARMSLPGMTTPVVFDPTWVRLEPDSGVVYIIPTGADQSQVLLGNGYTSLCRQRFIPQAFQFDYTCGFADAATLPDILRDLIGKTASFGPLNIAGDLLGGAGIASQSIGMDGLSQSINTTSSPMYAGYGARLRQYGLEIKEQIPTIRRYYKGVGLRVG